MQEKEFIALNKEMWKDFQSNVANKNLLVEQPSDTHTFILHTMAMQTLILNKGQGFKPLWIRNKNVSIDLLKSYVPSAEYVDLENLTTIEKLYSRFRAFLEYIKIWATRNTLNFKFAGIKYGDVMHDIYLSANQQGTLQKPNKKLKGIIRGVIRLHMRYSKTYKKHKIKAVLASHAIGFCACMIRSAILKNISVYKNNGLHRNTLFLSKGRNEMIEYAYSSKKSYIQQIMSLPNEIFIKEVKEVKEKHLYGNISLDAKYAYSKSNTLFHNRQEFNEKYNLDSNYKNIFIMLHAFTDYPHSHFNGMIFKDYGDWFLQTLDFAKTHKNANYIFKQHPSDKFYPIQDIDFIELFKDVPSNIKFLSTEDKIDTRSLETIADAVVTCVGSAGFEMPAFYAIPSIIAGDSPFSGYDFVKEPKTKKEYFSILENIDKIEKISLLAQKQAQAVYLFIYKYCTVDYSFIPIIDYEQHFNVDSKQIFYDKIKLLYESKKQICQNELARYSFEVSRNDFKALRTKTFIKYEDYLDFPFDITRPMPSSKYEVMKCGCKILKNLNIKYCLAEGTLLGIYRDGDIISHDTDIDIAIILPIDIDSIIREFIKNNFSIGRLAMTYGQIQQIVFYKDEVLFDIMFYQQVGDKLLSFCEKDYYFLHSAEYFKILKCIQFQDYNFYIPNEVEKVLQETYGINWRCLCPKPKDWRQQADSVYISAHPYDGDIYKVISKYKNV